MSTMKIGRSYRIDDDPKKENEQYTLIDNTLLKHLTVSETRLRRGKSTNGHKHEGKEEVYIFTNGQGTIQINYELIPVEAGDVICIPDGAFHKVCSSTTQELHFLAIFEKYEGR